MGCWMIKEKTGTPKTIVRQILHQILKKRKIYARFVPHALSAKQYNQRAAHAHEVLKMVKNELEFFDSIIMGNES